MMQLEQIKFEVQSLPRYDFIQLRNWIEDIDFEQWDEQIIVDSISGNLDFLKKEEMEAKTNGKLKDL